MADPQAALFNAILSSQNQGIGSDPALNAFQRTVSANDYWKTAAVPLLSARFDTSTWSPGTTLGVSAVQGFLGSLLSGIGNQKEAQQMQLATSVLPALYANPNAVANPGIDAEAFEGLKLSAARENVLRQVKRDESTQALLNELLTRKAQAQIDTAEAGPREAAKKLAELGAYANLPDAGATIPGTPAYTAAQDALKKANDIGKIERDYSTTLTTGDEAKRAIALNKAAANIFDALKKDSPLAASTAIVEYAKLQDPLASVRESDELRVSDPGGPLGILARYQNEIVQKGKLVPGAKEAMKELVPLLQQNQFAAYDELKNGILEVAPQYGANPANIKYIKPIDLSTFDEQKTEDIPAPPTGGRVYTPEEQAAALKVLQKRGVISPGG